MGEPGKVKVLIIEDEALVARELQIRLSKLGYQVVGVAASADTAIKLAEEHDPDLLLADIHIKGETDGIEASRLIRLRREIPVVFSTAYSDAETVARAKEVTPYGYIIKPIESRELEVAIEIALYKSRVESELKETRELLGMALQCVGDALLFLNGEGHVSHINSEMGSLLNTSIEEERDKPWYQTLGVKDGSGVVQLVNQSISSGSLVRLSPFVLENTKGDKHLADGVVGPREKGYVLILRSITAIDDEISQLADPSADRAGLLPDTASFVQMMLGIEADSAGNLPKEEKSQLLNEVEKSVNQTLRSTDLASRYGDDLLVASLPYTSIDEGEAIANSLLKELSSREYLNKKMHCRFSIGLAQGVQGDADPFELLRRSALALDIARESGGNRIHLWRNDPKRGGDILRPGHDRARSYHHILLLWNVMNTLGMESAFLDVMHAVVSHIRRSLGLQAVSLWQLKNNKVLSVTNDMLGSEGGESGKRSRPDGMQEAMKQLFSSVYEEQYHNANYSLYRLDTQIDPLLLSLEGISVLEAEDFAFMESLVDYLVTGIRSLAERSAVEQFEGAPQETPHLIFESESMSAVIDNIGMVAPTDATVLITGESGTGKEMVASLIHQSSPRKSRPFIIVDCSSVADSLIESELFGHEKGAFTGAVSGSKGRLREADGGTVLLDEIGELPLDIQSRLLRYVQDKQIISVGGKQYDEVDTRVIAATNRNLKQMIEEGSFREDLYYRLNVFSIELPPLRERSSDIPAIASHYLKHFSAQYRKPVEGFTPEAMNAMTLAPWKGNVRELQNVVNRAVILCRDTFISPIHLGLFYAEEHEGTQVLSGWESGRFGLQKEITESIKACMLSNEFPPIGRWLEDELILAVVEKQGGISSRAAQALNLPETTLRRKILKIRESRDQVSSRPGYWHRLTRRLPDYVAFGLEKRLDILQDCRSMVIAEAQQLTSSRSKAANLVGVSQPTYRKLLSDRKK